MSKKENKTPVSKSAATGKKAAAPKKTIPQKDFDFKAHNKKVASSRGENWRKKLAKGKLEASVHPSQLRRKRAEKGFSQEQMIKGTPIRSLSAFARIEKGAKSIEPKLATAFAMKLKVSVDELFKNAKNKMLVARFN